MAKPRKTTPAAKPTAGNETPQEKLPVTQTPPEVLPTPSPSALAPSDPPPQDGANSTPPPHPVPPVTAAGGPDESGAAGPSLIVTGPKKGRWRVGKKFGPVPVTLTVADLGEEEIEALENDPTLTVLRVDAPY